MVIETETIYTVLPALALDTVLSYKGETGFTPGQLVIVPVRGKPIVAVIQETGSSFDGPLKTIVAPLPYIFANTFNTFLKQAATYTMIPAGHLLGMSLLSDIKALQKDDKLEDLPVHTFTAPTLNPEQKNAHDAVSNALGQFQTFVLDGVTGSGKTEVYFSIINDVLQRGQKALVLLPEIALTEAIVRRFQMAFQNTPFIWHSGVTPAKKRKIWKTIQQPGPAVILGARSALFLPIHDLRLIVVDEEHDPSYKQDEQGIYNARDLAILRAKHEAIPAVLTSATPSLETYANIKNGRYQHLTLSARYADATMPDVHIIDRKEYPKSIITPPVERAIQERLMAGEQSLLFLNRRGFSTLISCFSCGHHWQCPGCHVDLTVHFDKKIIMCHYCGFTAPEPTACPTCQNTSLTEMGIGVEKIEKEARALFPDARIVQISSDTLASPALSTELFRQIEEHEVDLIIGTQVLAKGHHFPHLTCVAILDADRGLYQMDLRSAEKTFQLLHQVSGRAGRMAHHKGDVFIQTRDPEHPLFQALKAYDRDAFYEAELAEREAMEMPPFARLIAVTVSSLREDHVLHMCRQLAAKIPITPGIEVLGPAPSPMYRLRSRYRMRFLIRADRHKNAQAFTKAWLGSIKKDTSVTIHVDVDPLNFM